MAQENIRICAVPLSNFIFIPLVAKPHPIRTGTTDTTDGEPTQLRRPLINISGKGQIGVIMVSWHIENLNAKTTHHLERAINTQQILHSTALMLGVTSTRTGEVTHQQDAVQVRPMSERVKHIIQQGPSCVNVPDDAEDGTQSVGFICMRP